MTDEEIEAAFPDHAKDEAGDKRARVNNALLKVALGYQNGSTFSGILNYLGLTGGLRDNPRLTDKGRQYLYNLHKVDAQLTDLTARLRFHADDCTVLQNEDGTHLLLEAADEIERLREGVGGDDE